MDAVEWKRRFAVRIQERAGWTAEEAMRAAEAAEPESNLEPEDAADEEMSNWTDDE